VSPFGKHLKPPRHRHTPGTMNKMEEDFALALRLRLRAGEIEAWKFEPMTFVLTRINGGVRYTPDFLVVYRDHVALYEVKGHWEDDARAKIKMAAEMFPWFKWVAVTREPKKLGGGWVEEVFE